MSMKLIGIIVLISHSLFFLSNLHQANSNLYYPHFNKNSALKMSVLPEDIPLRAINDTFYLTTDCNTDLLVGNILINDMFNPENDEICYVFAPCAGLLTFCANGSFTLSLPDRFNGKTEFTYGISKKNNTNNRSEGIVTVFVENDNDCDGIADDKDLDNDNDGILNIDESNGLLDSDNDEIPDSYDIDSDNDGIVDNIEWQHEDFYIKPSESDTNENGWDDKYDIFLDGIYYESEDTDLNGIPDFLDPDSDHDGFLDITEGFDEDGDGFGEIFPVQSDSDKDGLDDAFDEVSGWSLSGNSTGSNSPLPDLNSNGIRDWRDNQNKSNPDENPKTLLQTELGVFIYPNPSDGDFTINCIPLSEEENIQLELINLKGNLVYSKQIHSGLNNINIGNFDSGIYVIRVHSASINYFGRLTIQ